LRRPFLAIVTAGCAFRRTRRLWPIALSGLQGPAVGISLFHESPLPRAVVL